VALTREIARLPEVRHVVAWISVNAAPLGPDGVPILDHLAQIRTAASVDGLYFNQDRAAVIQGRMADPRRPDEVVMTAEAARLLGLHVGESVPYGLFTNEQTVLRGLGTPRVQPYRRVEAKLVGLVWSVWAGRRPARRSHPPRPPTCVARLSPSAARSRPGACARFLRPRWATRPSRPASRRVRDGSRRRRPAPCPRSPARSRSRRRRWPAN